MFENRWGFLQNRCNPCRQLEKNCDTSCDKVRLSLTPHLLSSQCLLIMSSVLQFFWFRGFPLVLGDTVVNTLRLADLTPGSSAIVTAICGASRIASRLMEMGFVPGSVVEVLRRAPFGGPVQYRVHGVSISMRSAEAACVSVESSARVCIPSGATKPAQLVAG